MGSQCILWNHLTSSQLSEPQWLSKLIFWLISVNSGGRSIRTVHTSLRRGRYWRWFILTDLSPVASTSICVTDSYTRWVLSEVADLNEKRLIAETSGDLNTKDSDNRSLLTLRFFTAYMFCLHSQSLEPENARMCFHMGGVHSLSKFSGEGGRGEGSSRVLRNS